MGESNATDADESGGGANTYTSSDGIEQRRQSEKSTTQGIDFETGQPVDDAPPAETGDGNDQRQHSPDTSTGDGESQVFTQEDVNKIIADRLERERKKYSDYEELKVAAEKLEAMQAEQEEEEKVLAEKLADSEARRRELEIEAQERRIQNVVLTEAARMGFNDPSDAYLHVSVSNLELDEAGQPVNVTEQLEALKESKPYLFDRKAIPQVDPSNATRDDQQPGRTDSDRRREYFGQGGGQIWEGGGLRVVERE